MIGTGYVGLVSGVCFTDVGNVVYCVDKDKNKIKLGRIPPLENETFPKGAPPEKFK